MGYYIREGNNLRMVRSYWRELGYGLFYKEMELCNFLGKGIFEKRFVSYKLRTSDTNILYSETMEIRFIKMFITENNLV